MKSLVPSTPTPELRARLANYRLTVEQFDQLRDVFDDSCGICGRRGLLVIDHDHHTGKVRGLLCHGCNVGLGQLGDSVGGLARAVAYLQRPWLLPSAPPIDRRARNLSPGTSTLQGPVPPCSYSESGQCIRLTHCPHPDRILDGCLRRAVEAKAP